MRFFRNELFWRKIKNLKTKIINFVRSDYKGKIILRDYKNDYKKHSNRYEHFYINYSKKYGVSWYESKLGFIQDSAEEYYLN